MQKKITAPRRGSFWLVKGEYAVGIFLVDGRRVWRGLGRLEGIRFTAKGRKRTEAQIKAAAWAAWQAKREEMELAAPEAHQRGDGRNISEVMGEWIEAAPANGIKTITVEQHYKLMKKQYLAGVGEHLLADISILEIDKFKAFLSAKGLSPVTLNMRLDKLRTFLRWAWKRGYLGRVPEIERVKEPRKRPRTPQIHQVGAFMGELKMLAELAHDKRHRYYYDLHYMELLFVMGCGVRRSGPMFIKWADVYMEQGAALMREYKSGETLVFMPKVLLKYLKRRRERYPHHVWLFDNGRGELAYKDTHSMTTSFRRHKKRLGYECLEFKPLHGFRANFATVNLNELGIDSNTVSKLLDHSSFKTTERSYIADMAAEKRRALEIYEEHYLKKIFEEMPSKSFMMNQQLFVL